MVIPRVFHSDYMKVRRHADVEREAKKTGLSFKAKCPLWPHRVILG